MDDQNSASRRPAVAPKYRSSCDACQTAKVKCGQEKPVCHRCAVQEIECVYSPSRRMGRPRQKNKDQAAATAAASASRPNHPSTTPEGVRRNNNPPTRRDEPEPTASCTQPPQESRKTPPPPSPFGDSNIIAQPAPSLEGSDNAIADAHHVIMPSELQCTLDEFDFSAFQPHMDMPDLEMPQMDVDNHVLDMSMYTDISDNASLSHSGGPSSKPPLLFPISRAPGESAVGSSNDDSGSGTGSSHLDSDSALNLFLENGNQSVKNDASPASSCWQNVASSYDQFKLPLAGGGIGGSGNAPIGRREERAAGCKAKSSGSDCDCYASMLRSVALSNYQQPDRSPVSVDMVLNIENDTQLMLSQLLGCKSCCRDPAVQLLAMVGVSKTLSLLRRTAHCELKPRRMPSSAFAPRDGGEARTTSRGSTTIASSAPDCNLHVGNFKVADEARVRFLRTIFLARVRKLSTDLESVHGKLVNLPQDGMCKAVALVVDETFRGLQTIAGWMELWDY